MALVRHESQVASVRGTSDNGRTMRGASRKAEADERIARSAAASVLVAVACVQVAAVAWFELSPWKGGGFGMFSTLDSPARRRFSVQLWDAAGVQCDLFGSIVDSESRASERMLRLRIMPDRAELQRVALRLLAVRYVRRAHGLSESLRRAARAQAHPDSDVRLRVRSGATDLVRVCRACRASVCPGDAFMATRVEIALLRQRFEPRTSVLRWERKGRAVVYDRTWRGDG
jgi:hypothetical protein